MKFKDFLKEAGFKSYPPGWTRESVIKFAKTLVKEKGIKGGDEKGFFDACVEKMKSEMDEPEKFCSAVKDECTGTVLWRGKGKTKKEVETLKKKHPEKNV